MSETEVAVKDVTDETKIDPPIDETPAPEGELGGATEVVGEGSKTEKVDASNTEVVGEGSETDVVGEGSETEGESDDASKTEGGSDAVSPNTAAPKIRIVTNEKPLEDGEISYKVTDGKVVGPDGKELEVEPLKTEILALVAAQGGGRRRSRRHSKKRHNKRSKKQNGGKKRNSKKNSKRHSKRHSKK
jgi:hypothetical protein